MQFYTLCPACRGSGEVDHSSPNMDPAPCAVCSGRGMVVSYRPHKGIVCPINMDPIKETLDEAGL